MRRKSDEEDAARCYIRGAAEFFFERRRDWFKLERGKRKAPGGGDANKPFEEGREGGIKEVAEERTRKKRRM